VGFFMIKPSRYNLEMLRRELAKAISLISLGSNQILRFPHFSTELAKRFCNFKETVGSRVDRVRWGGERQVMIIGILRKRFATSKGRNSGGERSNKKVRLERRNYEKVFHHQCAMVLIRAAISQSSRVFWLFILE